MHVGLGQALLRLDGLYQAIGAFRAALDIVPHDVAVCRQFVLVLEDDYLVGAAAGTFRDRGTVRLKPGARLETVNASSPCMAEIALTKSISVRLEGGVGDHILGMRVLPFLRDRYPYHNIVIYSDSAGHRDQLQVAAMSPFVSRVVPVYQSTTPRTLADMGRIANIRPQDRELMMSADLFVDTYGEQLFAAAAVLLDVPVFDILGRRTELVVTPQSTQDASLLLDGYGDSTFVGMNLTKHGAGLLRRHESLITHVLQRLLDHPHVIVLNIFTSYYDFSHWPEPHRMRRQQFSIEESAFLKGLRMRSDRIVPCIDLPLPTIAALLTRCRYFIGVDNGIKHLAWALGVPHTLLHPTKPDALRALRWMPDLNRILLFECSASALSRHIADMTAAVV